MNRNPRYQIMGCKEEKVGTTTPAFRREFSSGIPFEELSRDEIRKDAILRNIQVPGDAAKNLSPDFIKSSPGERRERYRGARSNNSCTCSVLLNSAPGMRVQWKSGDTLRKILTKSFLFTKYTR